MSLNLLFNGVDGSAFFGQMPGNAGERLFVFALTDRNTPRIMEYSCDPDGYEAISNLVRSDDVLAIVRGQKIEFDVSSVVSLQVGALTHEDRMSLKDRL